MSVFFRKGDKVRLLTIEELRNKCYAVKNDWGGLWVIETPHSPQLHAYLQNEIYLLGHTGKIVIASYDNFVTVEVQGYGTINIPPVCLELIQDEVPELAPDVIDDVVQIMLNEDEVDIIGALDDSFFYDEDTKSIVEIAMQHKECEATPFTFLFLSDDSLVEEEPNNRSEKLADLYTEVVKVKIHLDEILDQIDELLKEEQDNN